MQKVMRGPLYQRLESWGSRAPRVSSFNNFTTACEHTHRPGVHCTVYTRTLKDTWVLERFRLEFDGPDQGMH
jgi:hypothetical protein